MQNLVAGFVLALSFAALPAVAAAAGRDEAEPRPPKCIECARDAQKEAYGLSPFKLDTRWKEWVPATCPSR